MKSVVVTGAAGFLGSHLSQHHLDLGHTVYGIDNFCSSRRDSEHLDRLKRHRRFKFFEADIADEDDSPFSSIDWGIRDRVDLVYNFACPASPPVYQRMPVETMMTCTLGTKRVLDMARSSRAVVVHASTSEVYGDPLSSPQRETDRGNVNPYGPRSCYDEGKRAAEALCFDYRQKYGVDARLVRIFNTFGEGMDPHDGRVVTNFVRQALEGQRLTIYGTGNQTRSFCYVDDLVRGIVSLGELRENPGTPINLGNPTEFSMKELAQHVIYHVKALGGGHPRDLDVSSFVDFVSLPTDDPLQRRPDITLARELLGWEPVVPFDVALRRTISYIHGRIAV